MFTCKYNRNWLKVLEVHYHDNIQELYNNNKGKYDILKCYQVNKCLPNLQEFHTLQVDLQQQLDDIFKKFSKNTRNEINKCYRDDNVSFIINMHVSDKNIHDFIVLFDKFNKLKKLGVNVNELRNSLIRNKKNVVLFKAVKDNNILVFNVYYFDQNRARLKCSVSIRDDNNQKRNLIGRANRTLCFEAIRFFKEKGCKIFDMGGISLINDKDKKNIDSFKSKFGGILVTEYEGNCPLSLKGKLFIWIYRLQEKFRR
ncbi:hypothetical protein [Xenorhabdus szentirmaii]|uniref:BioF2-like acetyltransferase domain-containing protein n=1 Tax=Xenorhabdus szentirmaii DSM 16338 TaxID=1427518 RepID=W1J2K5_9GAMM|nr:hypothetical protein [Xenorhabdus szentirmaii]PHM34353.1 hypothetical protein Xsze_00776 [Xenorhabdus szentirmaii DSM 16338]CDL84086.1 conserved hypothetical protein [Xenorhabdus szentirmaii DSM 16338]